MQLPAFITNYVKRQKGLRLYTEKLKEFLADNSLTASEKVELQRIVGEYDLGKDALLPKEREAVKSSFLSLAKDFRLSPERAEMLNSSLSYFGLTLSEVGIPAVIYKKCVDLASLDKNILPLAEKSDLGIIFKPTELLHFAQDAQLRRFKHITKTIQYKGFSSSIRIMKGFRYRTGEYRFNRTTQELLSLEDRGKFYVTNERVGFHGLRKQFAVLVDKISSLELRPEGLFVFKEGKEAPYIVTMFDYDVPVATISALLNRAQ